MFFFYFRINNNGVWWLRFVADRSGDRWQHRLETSRLSANVQGWRGTSGLLLHLQAGVLLRDEQSLLRLPLQYHRLFSASLHPGGWREAISLGREPANARSADRGAWSLDCETSFTRLFSSEIACASIFTCSVFLSFILIILIFFSRIMWNELCKIMIKIFISLQYY